MAIVELYRALSGSQYVYWNSSQAEPAGISNKVIVGELVTVDTVDTASIVALAVTSGSDVLFKWNGTDLSQFNSSSPTFINGSVNGVMTLSSSAESPGRNYIQISGSGTTGFVAFLANTPLDTYRCIFEVEYETINSAQYGGIVFFCSGSGSNFHAHALFTGGAGWRSMVNNGVHTDTGGTPTAVPTSLVSNPGKGRYTLNGVRTAGIGPVFDLYLTDDGSQSSSTSEFWNHTWEGTAPASGSTWNTIPVSGTQSCTKWGLAIKSSGGNALPMMKIRDIIIRRLPNPTT